MKILIIGGTRFLGRALVEAALDRGDRVTLFHRGSTGAELFPGVERIFGERDRDLDRLGGRTWDAVFDTCGFVPRIVSASARALSGRAGHYTFVSSISVYAEPMAAGSDESARVGTISDPAVEEITGVTYGPLKALCEAAAETALPGRVLHVRAGLLVGPNDYTDRFPYWVRRIRRGGETLIPDAPAQPIQFIDARDAAAWLLRMAERGTCGTFNTTGPRERITLGDFFAEANRVLGGRAAFVPVAPEFLIERGVTPWSEVPLWIPSDAGSMDVSIARALEKGLAPRSLGDTIRDTLAWLEATGGPAPGGTVLASPVMASLCAEREVELLEAWKRAAARS